MSTPTPLKHVAIAATIAVVIVAPIMAYKGAHSTRSHKLLSRQVAVEYVNGKKFSYFIGPVPVVDNRLEVPGGGTLELRAVSNYTNKSPSWWTPNNDDITPPITQYTDGITLPKLQAYPGEQAREFVFRASGIPAAQQIKIQFEQASDFAIATKYGEPDTQTGKRDAWVYVAAVLPAMYHSVDIKISTSTGPWTDAVYHPESSFNAGGSAMFNIMNDDRAVAAFAPVTETHAGTDVTVSNDVSDTAGRVVGIEKDGKLVIPTRIGNETFDYLTGRSTSRQTYRFRNLKSSYFRELQFQTRPLKCFNFGSIPLRFTHPRRPILLRMLGMPTSMPVRHAFQSLPDQTNALSPDTQSGQFSISPGMSQFATVLPVPIAEQSTSPVPTCPLINSNEALSKQAEANANRDEEAIGKPSAAIPELKRAIALDPNNASAYRKLASAAVDGGPYPDVPRAGAYAPSRAQYDQAVSYMRKAVAASPSDVGLRTELSQYLVGAHQLHAAIVCLQDASHLVPSQHPSIAPVPTYVGMSSAESENLNVETWLAFDLLANKQYAESASHFEKVSHLYPDADWAYRGLAAIQRQTGHSAEAAQDLAEAQNITRRLSGPTVQTAAKVHLKYPALEGNSAPRS